MTETVSLSEREKDFLKRLHDGAKLRLADREEDRARQKVRRLGLAKVVMGPRRWVLTASGWAYFGRLWP